jgi:hypothetical protein
LRDVTPYRHWKPAQCFGGKCLRRSQARNHHEALNDVISQKIELIMTTAVRTTNALVAQSLWLKQYLIPGFFCGVGLNPY